MRDFIQDINNGRGVAFIAVAIVGLIALTVFFGALVHDRRYDWHNWFPGLVLTLTISIGVGSIMVAWSQGAASPWYGRAVSAVVLALVLGVASFVWLREEISAAQLQNTYDITSHLASFPHRYEEAAEAYERTLRGAEQARMLRLRFLHEATRYSRLSKKARVRLSAGVVEGVCETASRECEALVCSADLMAWDHVPEMVETLERLKVGMACGSETIASGFFYTQGLVDHCELPDDSDAWLYGGHPELLIERLSTLAAWPYLAAGKKQALLSAVVDEVCEQAGPCCGGLVCASVFLEWGDEPWVAELSRRHGVSVKESCSVERVAESLAQWQSKRCNSESTYYTGEVLPLVRKMGSPRISPEPMRTLIMSTLVKICDGREPKCCDRELAVLRLLGTEDEVLDEEIRALAKLVGHELPQGLDSFYPLTP